MHGPRPLLHPGRQLLTYDDEGFVAQKGQTIEVPAGMEDAAREAALSCPEGAITTDV